MAKQFEFQGGEGLERHECESQREGDWIIFQCPQCEYERRLNWKTGAMKVSGDSRYILHSGMHAPLGIDPGSINPN